MSVPESVKLRRGLENLWWYLMWTEWGLVVTIALSFAITVLLFVIMAAIARYQ